MPQFKGHEFRGASADPVGNIISGYVQDFAVVRDATNEDVRVWVTTRIGVADDGTIEPRIRISQPGGESARC